MQYWHPVRQALWFLGLILFWLSLAFLVPNPRLGQWVFVPIFLFGYLLWRLFVPRTLKLEGDRIVWKRSLQPAVWAPTSVVSAIQYVPTAAPWLPRFYFVNTKGIAVLWVDRFTPRQMARFAGFLDVPLRTVERPPPVLATSAAMYGKSAAVGHRRGFLALFLVGAGLSVVLVAALAASVANARHVLDAYDNSGVCERPPTNLLSCRIETQATVTRIDGDGRIYLRFAHGLLPPAWKDTEYVYLYYYPRPNPPIAVGRTVQAELFDDYVTTVNAATTTDLDLVRPWTHWVLVPVVGAIPLAFLFFAFLVWRAKDDSWLWRGRPAARPARTVTRRPVNSDVVSREDMMALDWPRPGWLTALARATHQVWMAFVA